MVYAVTALRSPGKISFLAATELYGEWHHYESPGYQPRIASHRPGGVMSLVQFSEEPVSVLAIEQSYPIYHFDKSRITLAAATSDSDAPWNKRVLVELPFLHRISLFHSEMGSYLIAATLAGSKDFQEDWSRPGAVYAGHVPDNSGDDWSLDLVFEGISRNHGMTVAPWQGRQTLFVSGQEGMFALRPGQRFSQWEINHLLRHDVSDMSVFDLDGDGREEIVTIEPFHGNKAVIYRNPGSVLTKELEFEMSFGHVVWTGIIRGRRALILGNRSGPKDLRILFFRGDGTLNHETMTLDEGGGPANISVVQGADKDLILAANHVKGEVALYEITD